ncbi:MAG: hypothetical protein M5T61_09845 [Acidimicrobiia bacterium]|nr:hypothetical protein [Acidimicrobiia bacterium]
MATIPLRDYIHDELGVGVGGVRVRAFKVALDGTRITPHVAESYTASGTGRWSLGALDPSTSPAGYFDIELYNPATGQVRWRKGDTQLQVGWLAGPNGDAPLNPGSVTASHLAAGAATDTAIGTRTVTPAAPAASGPSPGCCRTCSGSWHNRVAAILGGGLSWEQQPADHADRPQGPRRQHDDPRGREWRGERRRDQRRRHALDPGRG